VEDTGTAAEKDTLKSIVKYLIEVVKLSWVATCILAIVTAATIATLMAIILGAKAPYLMINVTTISTFTTMYITNLKIRDYFSMLYAMIKLQPNIKLVEEYMITVIEQYGQKYTSLVTLVSSLITSISISVTSTITASITAYVLGANSPFLLGIVTCISTVIVPFGTLFFIIVILKFDIQKLVKKCIESNRRVCEDWQN